MLALFVAVVLPFTPIGAWFGFVVPPFAVLVSIGVLVLIYLILAELLKPWAIKTTSKLVSRRGGQAAWPPLKAA